MNSGGFIMIPDWVMQALGLSGNAALLYALIFSFTESSGFFHGTARYLAERIGVSRKAVSNILRDLEHDGLILRRDVFKDGLHLIDYWTNAARYPEKDFPTHGKNFPIPCEESSHPPGKNFPIPCEKTSHHNKEKIKDDKKKGKECGATAHPPPASPDKRRFVPPTVDEVRQYCRERGNQIDPERFVDFYASKGWKIGSSPMKDWRAAVRTWEKRDRASGKTAPSSEDYTFDQSIFNQ